MISRIDVRALRYRRILVTYFDQRFERASAYSHVDELSMRTLIPNRYAEMSILHAK